MKNLLWLIPLLLLNLILWLDTNRVWGATDALALPVYSVHQSPAELSHHLIEWLYEHDPSVMHNRDRVLFVKDQELTIVESYHLNLVQASEQALPFRPSVFTAIVKLRPGLDRVALKEIGRTLEWGGFLILLEDTYTSLLYEFNFFKLPMIWGPFHIYQKGGSQPHGKRHRENQTARRRSTGSLLRPDDERGFDPAVSRSFGSSA